MTLAPLLNASPIIQIHAYSAIAALIIGCIVFFRKKGTPVHKATGRVWVLLMVFVAISSFWIKTDGHFSWIHLLSIWTLISLSLAVYFIRKKNVRRHQGFMIGTFIGLFIAGGFTFLPARIMGQLVFGG